MFAYKKCLSITNRIITVSTCSVNSVNWLHVEFRPRFGRSIIGLIYSTTYGLKGNSLTHVSSESSIPLSPPYAGLGVSKTLRWAAVDLLEW